MVRSKPSLYLVSILLFMFILPVSFIVFQLLVPKIPLTWSLIGKWFLFWSVGVRLFVAGVRQITNPGFTARRIFQIQGQESYTVIRELGMANISLGIAAMLSLFKTSWSAPVAFIGALFFGLAGIQHVLKKPESNNELIALVSDLFIFCLLAFYLLFTL